MSNKKLAIDWLETVLISEPYSEEDFEHNERCWEQAKVMEEDGKHESYLYGHKVGFTKAKEMEEERIKDAYVVGFGQGITNGEINAEKYYNQTFKQQEQ
jgi:hypothetical protein